MDSRVEASVARAAEALFATQRPEGFWPNRRPTAVLGTAGAVVALHVADPERSRELIERGTAWLVSVQNADGGWGGVPGAASQLVPTVVTAAALRLTAPRTAEEPWRRALELLESLGGVESLADPGMVHMATTFLVLAGLRDMRGSRRIPLELLLLPRRLWRPRLSFRAAPFVAMAFIQAHHDTPGGVGRLLHRLARPTALRLLRQMERGENDRGGYGGDNWLTAVVCIGLCRADAPARMIADTVDYLRSNVQPDGSWHIMQGLDLIGGSYVARGLADTGYTHDPRLVRARHWLRGCQQDHAFPIYDAPPGGWGWEGPRGWPNFLDSANVLAALTPSDDEEPAERLRHGLDWLLSRQDGRGSWGTFVPDTTLTNDGPCPYTTAQCVETLLDGGLSRGDPRIVRALDWLLACQRPDGTYEGLWYRGLTSATATALVAFARGGVGDHPAARRAREALLKAQLADGSWGPGQTGTLGDDPSRGTVEETAWALRGLLAAGLPAEDERLRRAAEWLMSAQGDDGLWPASPVCLHIRRLAYYVDGLIGNGLVLRALGAYRGALTAGPVAEREAW
ncbi:prenyltransferase/squalene oxidase repeat-containing protein [Streptomyces rishiriensis]|uniref:prenyltransferase/squalene oxidase repeat-containing protein n=1 Tax=Streptomyces rishiriensis TaxID=68264 RepID=UPI0027D7C92F|nr:prenyltransferase/squalene oxidase repeat-containing protein [Streptomyces rishiriensis]